MKEKTGRQAVERLLSEAFTVDGSGSIRVHDVEIKGAELPHVLATYSLAITEAEEQNRSLTLFGSAVPLDERSLTPHALRAVRYGKSGKIERS